MAERRLTLNAPAPQMAFPRNGSQGLALVALILAGVLIAGLLATSLYLSPTYSMVGLVLLGLGVPLLVLVWLRPEFGLLAVVFMTSSFIPADIVDLRLPIGGGLDLRDLALLGLSGVLVLQQLSRRTIGVPWWPVGGPLLLFLVMALFSAVYAIAVRNVEGHWALSDLRILSFYFVFFLTVWTIQQPGQLKALLLGLFVIADLTVAVVFLQELAGTNNLLLEAMTKTRDWRVYEQGGTVRIIPAGHVLMHFVWLIALGLFIYGHKRPLLRALCAAQLVYVGAGHALTFTRAQWLAAALGLALILVVVFPRYRSHLMKATLLGIVLLLLLATLWESQGLSVAARNPVLAAVAQRSATMLTPSETLATGSLEWRDFEQEKALQAIKKQPLVGVGLGGRYRELTTYLGEARGYWTRGSIAADDVSRFTRYVHNSYLSIAVKMGIPSLLVLLWFCAAFLLHGWQLYRTMPETELKGVVLGVLAGFVGVLAWCLWHAHLIKAESTPVIALMTGLVGSLACTHCFSLEGRR